MNLESKLENRSNGLAESLETIEEFFLATEDHPGGELHRFSCVLKTLVESVPASNGEDDDVALIQFVEQGIEQLRMAADDDDPSNTRITELLDESTLRWGDVLTIPIVDPQDWYGVDMHAEPDVDDAPIDVPSARQIDDLIASLSKPTGPDNRPHEPPDAAAESIDQLDPELREAFLDDARAGVGSLEQLLLQLESDPGSGDAWQQVCRELHTLKGASASVGLAALAEQLHGLEDAIRDARQSGDRPGVDRLLSSVDAVRKQIQRPGPAAVKSPSDDPPPLPSVVVEPSEAGDDETVRVKASQLNRLMDRLAELVVLRNRRQSAASQLRGVHQELTKCLSKLRLLSRVEVSTESQLSSLQIGEVAGDVAELCDTLRECVQPIQESNDTVSHFIREFRHELVELQRVPVSGLFRRLQRVIRDAAKSEAKDVRLGEGGRRGEHRSCDPAADLRTVVAHRPQLRRTRNRRS